MEPKTKLQKKIVQLSSQLPDLNTDQLEYAREKLFEHIATKLKSGRLTCLDCGHQWQDTDAALAGVILGVTCPSCKRELKVNPTRKKVFDHSCYYQVIDTFKGYQLIRTYRIHKSWRAGKPQEFYHYRIYENWFDKEGKSYNIGMFMTSKWNEAWGGGYELRGKNCNTDYNMALKEKYVYPKKKFIPTLKRNGLRTSFHKINPWWLFKLLPTNHITETLFKAGQYEAIRESLDNPDWWPALKICIRNNYIIKDAGMWRDYIHLLNHFGKDLRNPKYVCPEDLVREHDRFVKKKQKIDDQLELEKKLKRAAKEEAIYKKHRSKYFGLKFTDGDLEVSFINSVKQLAAESTTLHHCAFTNGFHKKENILMFSVRVNGEVKATGAVNINKKDVQELRGQNNWQKEHNTVANRKLGKRATKLLQDNMITILNGKKKPRKTKQKLQLAS